mmetsp:Transcript_13889/g.19152  ORF Transcript_13889/g.19152 Transcript_13889/m.19152 type:complete len:251 (-) Transcript_13889:112-864(-)
MLLITKLLFLQNQHQESQLQSHQNPRKEEREMLEEEGLLRLEKELQEKGANIKKKEKKKGGGKRTPKRMRRKMEKGFRVEKANKRNVEDRRVKEKEKIVVVAVALEVGIVGIVVLVATVEVTVGIVLRYDLLQKGRWKGRVMHQLLKVGLMAQPLLAHKLNLHLVRVGKCLGREGLQNLNLPLHLLLLLPLLLQKLLLLLFQTPNSFLMGFLTFFSSSSSSLLFPFSSPLLLLSLLISFLNFLFPSFLVK